MTTPRVRSTVVLTILVVLLGLTGVRAYWLLTSAVSPGPPAYVPADPAIARDLETAIKAIEDGRYAPPESVYNTFYASIYDALFVDDRQRFVLDEIFSNLGQARGSHNLRVLDAGFGTGNEFAVLNHFYSMTGIDRSKPMARVAALKTPKGHFILGDFQVSSAFEAGSFDAIISLYSSIFYNPDFELILRNFHGWLTDGGLLFIDVWDSERFGDPAFWTSVDDDFTFGSHSIQYRASAKVVGKELLYTDHFVIDESHVYEQVHHMFYPSRAEFERAVDAVGFAIQATYDLGEIGDHGEKLYVLRRRSQ